MVRLRHFTLPGFALFCAATAFSQLSTDESSVLAAYQKLSENPSVLVQADGTEVYRNKTVHLRTIASWSYDAASTPVMARLEVRTFQDDVLTQRMVGDGENFYAYDLARHEYSVINYGGYGGRTDDYRSKLVQLANQSATGQSRYVLQFLNDAVSLGGARYRSWIPGSVPVVLPDGSNQDPVLNWRQYVDTSDTTFLMYYAAPKRSIVVRLDEDSTTGIPTLGQIYFNQSDQIGKNVRETDWTMSPIGGDGLFDLSLFAPYAAGEIRGWSPVVGPQPYRSG